MNMTTKKDHKELISRCWRGVVLTLMITVSGCGDTTTKAPTEKEAPQQVKAESSSDTPVPTPAETGSPKDRALAAKKALFERLSGELVAAMSSGGPSAAIQVCNTRAPEIAMDVGREHGLKIGRTSFKLRNPNNKPPAWAQKFVEGRTSEPQFLDVDADTFGAMLPIKLMPQCMTCHGPADEIDPKVLATLKELYPDDRATGFQVDDLRGWFWVEVPTESSSQESQDHANTTGLIQFGEMREVIGLQQHQGRVRLDEITKRPNLFAVGALEGLRGEVTIVDGGVTASTVVGDQLSGFNLQPGSQATLLVGDQVADWIEHNVESDVAATDYDQYLARTASQHGIDVKSPFVFSVVGEFRQLRLHVINGACPVHAERNGIELPAETRPFRASYDTLEGTLVGVFAQDAAGVLTHPGTSTHTHVVFETDGSDEKQTGHVEAVGLAAGSVVRFPRKRATSN